MNKDQEIYRRFLSLIIIPLLIIMSIFLLPKDSGALIGLDEGDLPKDIELRDLHGVPVNITNYFGKKPVIIVFWEKNMSKSFINYSLDVMRFLNGQYETYHESKGLEVFGIYTPEEEKDIPTAEFENVKSIVQMNDIKFPVLMDRGFGIFREYGVVALPSTIMINTNGKIEFIYPSFPLVAKKVFTENIEKLVGIVKPLVRADKKEKGSDTKAKRPDEALKELKKALSFYEEKDKAAIVYDPAFFHRISVYYVLSELYAEKGDVKTSHELLRKATRAALGIDGEEGGKPVYRSEDLMIYE